MSFIGNENGQVHAAGYFLKNDEACVRDTKTIPNTLGKTAENGGKYVPMGTVYPSNDGNAIGIVYEDVDVTNGDMAGSVVTKGEVYKNRLAEALESEAETALEALGFSFVDAEPTVTRPY